MMMQTNNRVKLFLEKILAEMVFILDIMINASGIPIDIYYLYCFNRKHDAMQ